MALSEGLTLRALGGIESGLDRLALPDQVPLWLPALQDYYTQGALKRLDWHRQIRPHGQSQWVCVIGQTWCGVCVRLPLGGIKVKMILRSQGCGSGGIGTKPFAYISFSYTSFRWPTLMISTSNLLYSTE